MQNIDRKVAVLLLMRVVIERKAMVVRSRTKIERVVVYLKLSVGGVEQFLEPGGEFR